MHAFAQRTSKASTATSTPWQPPAHQQSPAKLQSAHPPNDPMLISLSMAPSERMLARKGKAPSKLAATREEAGGLHEHASGAAACLQGLFNLREELLFTC